MKGALLALAASCILAAAGGGRSSASVGGWCYRPCEYEAWMLRQMRAEADHGVLGFGYPGRFPVPAQEPIAFHTPGPRDGYEFVRGAPGIPPHRLPRPETDFHPVFTNGLYDLGHEDIGYVRIESPFRPCVFVGESLPEVMNSDFRYFEQSTLMVPEGSGRWRSDMPLATRYIRLRGPVKSVTFSSQVDWSPCAGDFACSDARRTKIWRVAAETLRLCRRTFILDGIKRDRLPWAGDLAVEILGWAYAFGDAEPVMRTLSVLGSGEPSWGPVNGIDCYSFWWVIGHDLLQRYYGEPVYLKLHYPRIRARMEELATHEDDRGWYTRNLSWDFLDWTDRKGNQLASEVTRQVIYFAALEAASRLAVRMGDGEGERLWKGKAEKLRASILAAGFDRTRHARALAIVFDLVSSERARELAREIAADDLPPTVTPYMATFEVWALAKGGEPAAALKKFEAVWGAMVDFGADTFWEGWDAADRGNEVYEYYGRPFAKSLCHAWSAAPAFLIPGVFLGIRPASDGWKTVTRQPMIPDFAPDAKVRIPALAAPPTVDAVEHRLAAADERLDEHWGRISTAEEFAARTAAFRSTFRAKTGFNAVERTPLNARSFGLQDHGAFRIEKMLFESAPGEFVTALVFLPDARKHAPPYAGFVFIPGHSSEGKAAASYLQTCELAARNGLAALIYDPLGQGERSQGAGLRSSDEHVRIGAYAALLGETTATYMLRDAARALDCLAERKDIDPRRLGVCGNSGGGTLSAFLMVADDRVKAAAPSCYLSSAREQLLACGPQDAEQNFFGGASWGFNHAALVLSAGCPVLINAAVEDFFQITGSRVTYRVVRRAAEAAGLPDDRYALSEAPGRHAMSKVHREQAVGFLLKHLTGEDRAIIETETTPLTAENSRVTPAGEVSSLPGFRSIYETLREKFGQTGVSLEQAARNARPLVLRECGDVSCREVIGTLTGPIVRGRQARLRIGAAPHEGEASAVLFAEGARLVPKTVRKGKRSYYERRGDDEVVAVDFYLEGRSLVAFRAAELLTLADELKARTGVKPALAAEGRAVVVARFALAAQPDAFAAVDCVNGPKPWSEMLRARNYLSFADSGALDARALPRGSGYGESR